MGKRLLTTYITSTVKMPVKAGILNHLQNAHEEVSKALAIGAIGETYDAGNGYVLYGCANTGSGSNYIIGEGAILYGGSIYLVDSATLTLSGSNVVTLTLTDTFVTGASYDPVKHTDGLDYNVCRDRKLVIGQGLSGSGDINYSALIFAPTKVALTPTANYTSSIATYCRKNSEGLVTLEGEFKCGAGAAASQTITTLPTGYRPPAAQRAHVTVYDTALGGTFGQASLVINTDGTIVLDSTYMHGGSSLTNKRISLLNIAGFYNK